MAARRLALAFAFIAASCGSPSTGPTATASQPSPVATPGGPAPTTNPPNATEPPGGPVSVYTLPEGRWSAGELHLEISGGIEVVFDLPFEVGETAAGRTTLTFAHRDPADSRWSLGLVRLSFFPDADSLGVEAGGIVIAGPCTMTLGTVAVDSLAGELSCGDDMQATFQGDPREVTLSGSFSSTR